MASGASLHRTEIGLLERDERTPRIETAIELAGALGIPVADLFDGIEQNPGGVSRGALVTIRELARATGECRTERG